MKLGPAGLALLKRFEGLELRPYKDTGGVDTVGYGHTAIAAELAKVGLVLTEAQAEYLLRLDVADAEEAVNGLGLALTQNQFDALVCFTFNVGAAALRKSTLLRKLRAGDAKGAAAEFGRWTLCEKKVLPGLVRRRAAEKALFLSA